MMPEKQEGVVRLRADHVQFLRNLRCSFIYVALDGDHQKPDNVIEEPKLLHAWDLTETSPKLKGNSKETVVLLVNRDLKSEDERKISPDDWAQIKRIAEGNFEKSDQPQYTLKEAPALADNQKEPEVWVFDCRREIAKESWGRYLCRIWATYEEAKEMIEKLEPQWIRIW